MMIDAVLSYHLNPQTCGVAKFNRRLARELGVRCLPLGNPLCDAPLISIKPEELPVGTTILPRGGVFDLFVHGRLTSADQAVAVRAARRVYAANPSIAASLRPMRPTVVEAFCPSTLEGNPTRGIYRVLVFGMAHKLVLPHFERLKAQLDREHPDYTISLSTAIHEGSPWDDGLHQSIEAMHAIFGDHLRVLGFLGDDALAKELQECDAVAAYFTPALRANNTSAWAALDAGKPLYTNTDADSPSLDVAAHSWPRLLDLLR